jgi:hypothetical protein
LFFERPLQQSTAAELALRLLGDGIRCAFSTVAVCGLLLVTAPERAAVFFTLGAQLLLRAD